MSSSVVLKASIMEMTERSEKELLISKLFLWFQTLSISF